MPVNMAQLGKRFDADETTIAVIPWTFGQPIPAFRSGDKIRIDDEYLRVPEGYLAAALLPGAWPTGLTLAGNPAIVVPVLRGREGTATVSHAAKTAIAWGDAFVDLTIRAAPGAPSDKPGLTPWSPFQRLSWDYVTQTHSCPQRPDGNLIIPPPTSIGLSLIQLGDLAPGAPGYWLATPSAEIAGAIVVLMNDAPYGMSVGVQDFVTSSGAGGFATWFTMPSRGGTFMLLAKSVPYPQWVALPSPIANPGANWSITAP